MLYLLYVILYQQIVQVSAYAVKVNEIFSFQPTYQTHAMLCQTPFQYPSGSSRCYFKLEWNFWINEFGAGEHMIHSAVVCDDYVIT